MPMELNSIAYMESSTDKEIYLQQYTLMEVKLITYMAPPTEKVDLR
jgi:hypothetical protein